MPIGTRVRLASGGPVMLVVDFDAASMSVVCAWPGGERRFDLVCLDFVRRFHIIEG